MPLFYNYPNADAAVINLLKQLHVKFAQQYVIVELEKHPDYPSLLAISDVLNWFKINNTAYRITTDELTEVPTPFIAHTTQNDEFVLVNKIANDNVYLSDDKRINYHIKLDELKTKFKGVVLTAEIREADPATLTQSLLDRFAPYKTPAAIAILGFSLILFVFYFIYLM